MAAANVLTAGTTATSSSDVSPTADTVYGLKTTAAGAVIYIDQKDDAGAYHPIGRLENSENRNSVVLSAGTYRFRRPAGPSCGVYSG